MKTSRILILFATCTVLFSGCGKGFKPSKQTDSTAVLPRSSETNDLVQDSVCIFQDDFESAPSPFIQNLGKGIEAKIITGGDAISGEKSLCLDSMNSRNEWILSAETSESFKLPPNKGYIAQFKYHIVDTAEQSAENFFSVSGGEKRFYARWTFASGPGQKGKVEFAFVLPENADDAALRFSSRGACRTIIDDIKIRQVEIKIQSWLFEPDAFIGMRKIPTNPNMLDLSDPSLKMTRDEYFPIVDEFGQFRHTEWPGKVHSLEELKASIKEEQKYIASRPDIPGRDNFGGLAGSADEATKTEGFTTAKVNGKWYFRDPEGNLFWSVGITCVGAFQSTIVTDRENYFEKIDPEYIEDSRGFKPGTYYCGRKVKSYALGKKNIVRKYGKDGIENYWKIATVRLKKWGMNTCGSWSSRSVMRSDAVPFTYMVHSRGAEPLETKRKLYKLWRNIPDYFTPAFKTRTIKAAKSQSELLKSRYCIGGFVDNEISWQRTPCDTALAVLSCPPDQPAKIAMRKMLRKKYSEISSLNKAWKSSYADWEDFLKKTDFEPDRKTTKADLLAFEKLFCERYFNVCRTAIKEAASNALYLGCRFSSRNEIVERAAFEICDVVSYNMYKRSVESFSPPPGARDKPVIIGEFHIGRTDKGSPYGGLLEAPTAERAAEAYKKYMISAASNPHIVGAHWFQWFDIFVTGRGDGANATCGFVSTVDVPDYTMTDACREISSDLYRIRAEKD
ncbi:MAG: beta-galactosidase [Kiritimatiellia bacterium]